LTAAIVFFGSLSLIEPLTALTSLVLEKSNFYGDLSSLSSLTAVTTLKISQSDDTDFDVKPFVGDLSSLGTLVALTYLELNECSSIAGDLASLAPLSALVDLYLVNSVVGGHLSSLAPLLGLTRLYLSSCEDIFGHVTTLAPLTTLGSLCINACGSIVLEGCPLVNEHCLYLVDCTTSKEEREAFSWIRESFAGDNYAKVMYII
jgi:hypothetical protein